MTDRIDLTGIEVEARHGVLTEEKERDQTFVVDLSVFFDGSRAAVSDDLGDTIDYGELVRQVHDVVGGDRHNLIETVAERIADAVLADRRIERVVVTVHKPEAPIPLAFGDVAYTIDRAR